MTAHGYGTTVWRQGNDAANSYAEARVFLDARNSTEYGILRTYARVGYGRSSGGDDNSGSQPRRGQTFAGSGGYANLQTGFGASEAFVQLGGLIAGRTTSFASVGLSAAQYTTANPSGGRVNQIGYTASLGNGMSLTAGIEDGAELRNGTHGAFTTTTTYSVAQKAYTATQSAAAGLTNAAGTVGGAVAAGEIVSSGVKTAATIPNNVPDAVVSFDVAQSWGTVKIAGVLHNVAPAGIESTASSKTGYALMGATKINLPMIAAGDNLQLYGAYGVGASGRVIGNTATDTTYDNYSYGVGRVNGGLYDAVQTATTLTMTKSYSYGAQFQHFFAPTLSAYVAGNYGKLDMPGSVQNTTTRRDIAIMGVGLGLIWSPVAGLEINPEVAYRKATSSDVDVGSANAKAEGSSLKSDDSMTYRLRIARSF